VFFHNYSAGKMLNQQFSPGIIASSITESLFNNLTIQKQENWI